MVKIYSQPGCTPCRRVKSFLERNQVAFEDIDISTDETAFAHVQKLGYQQTPVIEANGTHWSGYDPEKLANLK